MLGARIRAFAGEKPSLPRKPAEARVIGRDKFFEDSSPPLEGQYGRALLIMEDFKEIVKAAILEVLAEVLKK